MRNDDLHPGDTVFIKEAKFNPWFKHRLATVDEVKTWGAIVSVPGPDGIAYYRAAFEEIGKVKESNMKDTWTYELRAEPEFNEEYPGDPVDWEFQLVNGTEIIFITFTGISDDSTEEDIVRPQKEEDVVARVEAMVKGLNAP
jgi:hypothetical protein